MRYSPYLQQCLRDLQESREYESDVALVSMIQIQHLSERISDVSVREGSTEAIPGVPSAPAAAYMSIFQAELSKIQSSLGRSLKNNSKCSHLLRAAESHDLHLPRILASVYSLNSNKALRTTSNRR